MMAVLSSCPPTPKRRGKRSEMEIAVLARLPSLGSCLCAVHFHGHNGPQRKGGDGMLPLPTALRMGSRREVASHPQSGTRGRGGEGWLTNQSASNYGARRAGECPTTRSRLIGPTSGSATSSPSEAIRASLAPPCRTTAIPSSRRWLASSITPTVGWGLRKVAGLSRCAERTSLAGVSRDHPAMPTICWNWQIRTQSHDHCNCE